MPAIFLYEHVVREDEIDPQGHVNNVAYFAWMQNAAIAHSTAQGWSPEGYRQQNWAWVVRSHFIEYRRPAFAGDRITLKTWVADMNRFTSLRKYEMYRNESLIARAETNWAFVHTPTARLLAIPVEVAQAFELTPQ